MLADVAIWTSRRSLSLLTTKGMVSLGAQNKKKIFACPCNTHTMGGTVSTARTSLLDEFLSSNQTSCVNASDEAVMGNINIKNVKIHGGCDLDFTGGSIQIQSAMNCQSDDAFRFASKTLVKQEAKATSSGFQLGNIEASTEEELTNRVEQHLRRTCHGGYSSTAIADLNLDGLDCGAGTQKFVMGKIGIDKRTDCIFKTASEMVTDSKTDQKAEAKQDLSFLMWIVIGLIVILLLPELLPMVLGSSVIGSAAKSPWLLGFMVLGVVWLLIRADCHLWRPFGHHVCKTDEDKKRYETLSNWVIAAYPVVALIVHFVL